MADASDLDVTRQLLGDQLLSECTAMAKYALACGIAVPVDVLESVDAALAARGPASPSAAADRGTSQLTASAPAEAQLDGARVGELARLGGAHQQLAALIAPASPRTVLHLEEGRSERGYFNFLGPVRLVRSMIVVAMACVVGFILLATSPDITHISGDIFESSGATVLINEVFFLTAAGAGAAFAILFKTYRYIANGTYDPKYEASYWVQFILGLIAGLLLATLIPFDEGANGEATGIGTELSRPLLALLGGFSAGVVYRILDRLGQTAESLVKGDTSDLLAAQEAESRARAAERAVQARLEVAALLMRLQAQMQAGASANDLRQQLDRMLGTLVPVSVLQDTASPAVASGNRTLPAPVTADAGTGPAGPASSPSQPPAAPLSMAAPSS